MTGLGAKLAGGRWNSKGTALLYCAGTLSLCALETFVHVDPEEASAGRAFTALEIPDDIFALRTTKRPAEFPSNWRAYPPETSLQSLGDAWVKRGDSLVLELPSAVIPTEANYLLNPRHPDMIRVVAQRPHSFEFDRRMGK